MTVSHYDLLIVGGGMVGTSLACALANSMLNIAIIEAFPVDSEQQPSYDDRAIALAYGSQRIFETIGLWQSLAPHSTAISNIHVSDRGHFGVTRFAATAENVPALGQVLTAKMLGKVLHETINHHDNLTLICPAKVTAIHQQSDQLGLTLNNGDKLTGQLLVAADGGQSTIRQLLHLPIYEHDYQQTAITANITPERPHNGHAFERFTDSGPLALLPMADNHCSLVWTVATADASHILALSAADFICQLQQRFGYRLGTLLTVGQRSNYPLKLIQSQQTIQQRVLLIGNAAHNLHPIAGQGFNLGLRDVAALADVIIDNKGDCGHPDLLTDYQQWRQQDQHNITKVTSHLVSLFSNDLPILNHLRGAGLSLVDTIPVVKHWLARHSMGIAGKQPRLARGITL